MSFFPVTAYPHALHAVLEAGAISSGAWYYRYLRRMSGAANLLEGGNFSVLLGCLFGAALGNKLVFWLEVPHLFPLYWNSAALWFAGQSMVGGLLGGLAGVEVAKKLSGMRHSTGDAFVFPILLALIIGRLGCFLAGLDDGTYGIATDWPWGVDFGDGIARHPTQLYEMIFAALLWLGLYQAAPVLAHKPGLLFKLMLCAYLLWRLLVDFLKPTPYAWFGMLSGIQLVCLLALLAYIPVTVRQWKTLPK